MIVCLNCGTPIDRQGMRRKRIYCSTHCGQAYRKLQAEARGDMQPLAPKPCRCDHPLIDTHEDDPTCVRCGHTPRSAVA